MIAIELEPNVRAYSAFLVPSAGIVDPPTLVYRLHTLASRNGAQFVTGTEVAGLAEDGRFIHLLGIDSPGLAASLAVAKSAKSMVEERI